MCDLIGGKPLSLTDMDQTTRSVRGYYPYSKQNELSKSSAALVRLETTFFKKGEYR